MDLNSDFKVVFEDTHLMVLSKCAGLLSQGEITGDKNLVDLLRVRWGRHYVGLVHRLDRNTTGLMVVAKRTKAARRLTESLQSGQLQRWYRAWVQGQAPNRGRWTHKLLKDSKTNVVTVNSKGKESILDFETIQTKGSLSLVEFHLQTGRSHQIRVQASAEGFPLVGDAKYGAQDKMAKRPLLHSYKIKFPHPMGGEMMEFVDDLPPDMQ